MDPYKLFVPDLLEKEKNAVRQVKERVLSTNIVKKHQKIYSNTKLAERQKESENSMYHRHLAHI